MFTTRSFNRAEDCALNLFKTNNIIEAPVPVHKIAKNLGLDVMEYNLGEGASGVLVINNKKGTIGYNPKDSYERQRFTISHEIGHFLLHRDDSELFVDKDFLIKKYRNTNTTYSPQEYKQEQEANAFAAALLIPRHLLEIELAKEDIYDYNEVDLITMLAKKFQVSVAAMSFRIANLNIFFN